MSPELGPHRFSWTPCCRRPLTNPADCSLFPPRAVAVFYGLIGVCYMMFGILGFLAELRFERLRNTVLWPFAFMLRYIGRGVTYVSFSLSRTTPSHVSSWHDALGNRCTL